MVPVFGSPCGFGTEAVRKYVPTGKSDTEYVPLLLMGTVTGWGNAVLMISTLPAFTRSPLGTLVTFPLSKPELFRMMSCCATVFPFMKFPVTDAARLVVGS